LVLACLQACSDGQHPVMKSSVELGKYLKLDAAPRAVVGQVLTLPEAGGMVPGPTDYVSLVASIRYAPDILRELLAGLPRHVGERAIPAAFTHPSWLPIRERAVLGALAGSATPAFDATSLLVAKARRAIAIPVDDTLLLYVEYAAP
jgi:hypothetical protein